MQLAQGRPAHGEKIIYTNSTVTLNNYTLPAVISNVVVHIVAIIALR